MSESEPKVVSIDTVGPVSFWKLGVAVMMAGILVFVGFILLRLVVPAKWGFTIEAATEVAEVILPPKTETRWLVDGATICSRTALALPDLHLAEPGTNPCGSRAWKAWRVPGPEQVLRLNGNVNVTMQMRAEGGFAMSLRAAEDQALGTFSVVGVIDDIDVGSTVNLIWDEIPAESLTLPFLGATTLGRSVSWSSNRMLRQGNVVVYTADESADKRTMVDTTGLMLGDQVRLGEPEPGKAWPKGFIRIVDGDTAMQVVAFGHANSLRIERFGESGFDFKPGLIRKLAADPAVAFWGSVLAAYMTLILSLQPFVGGGGKNRESSPATDLLARFMTWLRRRPDK